MGLWECLQQAHRVPLIIRGLVQAVGCRPHTKRESQPIGLILRRSKGATIRSTLVAGELVEGMAISIRANRCPKTEQIRESVRNQNLRSLGQPL